MTNVTLFNYLKLEIELCRLYTRYTFYMLTRIDNTLKSMLVHLVATSSCVSKNLFCGQVADKSPTIQIFKTCNGIFIYTYQN